MTTLIKEYHLANSKLVNLCRTLSSKEFKQFKDWLLAPWCKKNKYYLPFYELLVKASPSFLPKNLKKEQAFIYLYGPKKYNNALFNNLITSFTKELQNYLAIVHLQKTPHEKDRLLRQHLWTNNTVDLYEDFAINSVDNLENKSVKSTEDYLHLNRLHQAIYFQTSGHHRYERGAPNLFAANHYLDVYYLLEKYKYWHEASSRLNIVQTEQSHLHVSFPLLQELQDELSLVAIDLYEVRLKRSDRVSWKEYLLFKKKFLSSFDQLPFSLRQSFLIFCINDIIYLDAAGHISAIEELFSLYKLGLQKDLLIRNKGLNEATFNNIVLTACHVEDLNFLEKFIDDYEHLLPAPLRKEAFIWALTQLDYANGNYEKVVKQYNNWLPKNKHYAIQAKVTLLKANFKLVLFNKSSRKSFNTYCKAFEKYIRRSKLYTANRNTAYLKLIQYNNKIVTKFYDSNNLVSWEKLEQSIEKEKLLLGKRWLKKEINLLKEKVQKKS